MSDLIKYTVSASRKRVLKVEINERVKGIRVLGTVTLESGKTSTKWFLNDALFDSEGQAIQHLMYKIRAEINKSKARIKALEAAEVETIAYYSKKGSST